MQTTNISREKTFDFSPKAATTDRHDARYDARTQTAAAQAAQTASSQTISQAKTPGQMPLKSFRTGALCVSIWENEGVTQTGEPTTYKTVSFERRYKDPKSGEWKTNNSLRVSDLPKATLILQKAYEYLILTESEPAEEIY